MLPEVSLDDEEYDEIIDEARNRIISLYPEWTDFNAHDPGITMLELFAVMKESQQFYADQIGEEARRKFLKLLGIRRMSKRAARSFVRIRAEENYRLLESHKLAAEGLCFETVGQKQLVKGDICSCLAVQDGKAGDAIGHGQMEFDAGFRFRVFGVNPRAGNHFYICFASPLPVGETLNLYIQIWKEENMDRNPVGDFPFIPLVRLEWEYYGKEGWRRLEGVQDDTYSFLFDGFVWFSLEEAMEWTDIHGQDGYFLRTVLCGGGYDMPPVLTGLSMNVCEVRQRDTLVEWDLQQGARNPFFHSTELGAVGMSEVYIGKGDIFYPTAEFEKEIREEDGEIAFAVRDERMGEAECVLLINREVNSLHRRKLGRGNGFPCQEFDLEDLQAEYDSFEILVQDIQETEGFRFWHKVEDFSHSSPEDRHYIWDCAKGIIRFGDCIHGMAPEGQVILAGYARTMGSDGNVKAGTVTRFLRDEFDFFSLANLRDGFGGRDEETLDHCFQRAGRSLREASCAVTAQDYERYARQTPGLVIESSKVLSIDEISPFREGADETGIHLVVKPYRWEPGSACGMSYRINIENYLETFRMVGSRVFIFLPEHVEVSVYIEAVVKAQYLHVKDRVREAVGAFFRQRCNAFGGVVAYGRLYGYLDRQDFILEIRSLDMDTRESGVRRNREGDVILPPYGIPVLREVYAVLTAD